MVFCAKRNYPYEIEILVMNPTAQWSETENFQLKILFFRFSIFFLKVINKADKINQLEKLNLEYETQIKNLERDLQEKHDEVNEITEKMSVCERNLNSTRNSICPEKVSRRYLASPIIAMPFN